MVRKPVHNASAMRMRPSSLSSLEPIDTAPFRHPSNPLFVWGTVLFTWLISLLPWRMWPPAPDLLLLALAFWCVNEPRRVTMVMAFVFGLLMDVHDTGLLGEQALTYSIVAYGAVALTRRLQRFNSVVQAMHMLPVFIVAEGLSGLVNGWVAGQWLGWDWLWSALFTTALWPLADILLHLPQRRREEIESGAV